MFEVNDPPSRPPRPLLELFPPTGARERPPGPLRGTALPPQLPHSHAPLETPGAPRLDPLSYDVFYGLNEKPFGLSSDPKFFYHSTSHERVLHGMLKAIHRGERVLMLTGGPGVGKTTLCRTAARELDRRIVSSILFDPFVSVDELLTTVLVDFGVMSPDDLARVPDLARDVLMTALGSFLESLASLKATAVVIIDEAQNVPPAVLAEVAAALPAAQVQLVLVGQRRLDSLLEHPELGPLAGRLGIRLELGPLANDEIAGYVTHRLSVAGSSSRVDFSETAFARIYELSRGVPRVVNLLCDRALWRGSQSSENVIDARLIDGAAQDLDPGASVDEQRMMVVRVLMAIALIGLTLVGAAAAAWVFRDDAARVFLQWQNVPPPPGGPVRSLPVPLSPIPAPEDALPPFSG